MKKQLHNIVTLLLILLAVTSFSQEDTKGAHQEQKEEFGKLDNSTSLERGNYDDIIPIQNRESNTLSKKIFTAKKLIIAAGIKDKELAEITDKVEQVCHEFNARIVKSWLMDDPEVAHDYCDWLYVDKSAKVVKQMEDILWKKLDTDQGPPDLYIHGYIPIFCSALEEEDSQ